MNKLFLYYIDMKYVRDLSKIDDHVLSVSPQRGKEKRPFLGVVVLVNGKNYCIPLTSPKEKFKKRKSQVDFLKIFDERKSGAPKLIGVLNLNSMIPVERIVLTKVNLHISEHDGKDIASRKALMQKQLRWCRDHADTIINRANKVYDMVTDTSLREESGRLCARSCDFQKLEKVLERYTDKRSMT